MSTSIINANNIILKWFGQWVMPTSTVILIYKIVGNKYNVESIQLSML